MANRSSTKSLAPVTIDEFVPSVNRWVGWGSWLIVFATASAIVASFSVKYRTTVKAAGTVRPSGEARLVQTVATGEVVEISARNNTAVDRGEALVKIDTAALDTQLVQLKANLQQGEGRLQQVEAQLIAADQQLTAETAEAQRTVAALSADYDQIARTNQNQTIEAQAAVEEATSEVEFAAREVESFSQLVDSGAIASLQLSEKQTALETAQARLKSLQASLNPSGGDVQAAKERIAQAEASKRAMAARLAQSQQQLVQQKLEIQQQLQATQQEIRQVELKVQNAVVRSPISGTLHELSLRNPGQMITAGDTIASVIPTDASIEIRALVPTTQINKVSVGLPAKMRVSACPFSEFGTAAGSVQAISPDILTLPSPSQIGTPVRTDAAIAAAFYEVVIKPDESLLTSTSTGRKCALQPGTEGRITIISREETIIAFLRRKAGLLQEI